MSLWMPAHCWALPLPYKMTLLRSSLKCSDERLSFRKTPPVKTCHYVLWLCCTLTWPRNCLSSSRVSNVSPSLCGTVSCNSDQFFQKIRRHHYITWPDMTCLMKSLREIIKHPMHRKDSRTIKKQKAILLIDKHSHSKQTSYCYLGFWATALRSVSSSVLLNVFHWYFFKRFTLNFVYST